MTVIPRALPALVLLTALACGGARAQTLPGGKGPLDVEFQAGAITTQTCTAHIAGAARLTQGPARVQADTINMTGTHVGDASSDCIWSHVEAIGHVYYVTPGRAIRADRGVYDRKTAIADFTGDVTGLDGSNVISAPHATLNTTTGELNVEGGARVVLYTEKAYDAAGTGWRLDISPTGLSFTGPGGAPVTADNPGADAAGATTRWTSPTLQVVFTTGACSFGGKAYAYTARVVAGGQTYLGCGERKSGGAS